MRMSSAQFQRESIASMLQQQTKLAKTQNQLATGRRVLTPADDPAAAARALDLTKAAESFEQYNKNAEQAKLRLSVTETVLDQATNLIQRIRELTVQANNATNDSENRRQISSEIQQRFDQLVELANSSDGNGEYLFSGYSTRTPPFARDGGEIVFQGDQGKRMVQVGPNRQLAVDHSGFDVFMKVPNGNGNFVIRPSGNLDGGSNQGAAVIANPGVVLDAAGYDPRPHRIEFSEDPDVEGGLLYSVSRLDGLDGDGNEVWEAVELSPGETAGAFQPGQAIQFNGIAVTLNGKPAEGDSFTVEGSRSQSVFRTVQDLIGTLTQGGDSATDRAAANNGMSRSLGELDQVLENLLRVRSEIGGRLNAIDTEVESNQVAHLEITSALSTIEDLDYAEAISRLNLQLVGMQAAQQSYMRIQGLSLFNFM